MTKSEMRARMSATSSFSIRIWDFFRHSSFVIRHSCPGPDERKTQEIAVAFVRRHAAFRRRAHAKFVEPRPRAARSDAGQAQNSAEEDDHLAERQPQFGPGDAAAGAQGINRRKIF